MKKITMTNQTQKELNNRSKLIENRVKRKIEQNKNNKKKKKNNKSHIMKLINLKNIQLMQKTIST